VPPRSASVAATSVGDEHDQRAPLRLKASSGGLRLFLSLAGDRPTIAGGLKVAVVVGTALNVINQGEPLLALRFDEVRWWKVGLTYLVPFCVSVFSAARIRMIHGGGE
jgi:hypothetical protein